MKDENRILQALNNKLIWIALGLGMVVWVLEAALHVFVLREGSLASQLLNPGPHEIWMRLAVVGLIVAFGVCVQFIVNQRKRSEKATKRAYAELKLAHAELAQILDTIADGVCVIDRHFKIIRASEALLTLLGIGKDEAIGRHCYDVAPCPLCNTPECPMTRIMRGEKRLECEAVKEREDGTRMSCTVVATPVQKHDGEIVAIVKSFRLPCEPIPTE